MGSGHAGRLVLSLLLGGPGRPEASKHPVLTSQAAGSPPPRARGTRSCLLPASRFSFGELHARGWPGHFGSRTLTSDTASWPQAAVLQRRRALDGAHPASPRAGSPPCTPRRGGRMAGLERRLAPWRVRSAGQSPGANAEAATSNRLCVTTLLRKRFPRKAQRAGPRASGRWLPAESPAHGRRAHRPLSLFPGGVQSSVYAVTPFLWKPTQ